MAEVSVLQPTVDPQAFRRALGTFTTGVTIITARGADDEPVGVTANSFNSVSLDPPLVLWSLAKNAASLPVYEQADHFAIHILAAGQEDLSNRFAMRGEDKFAGLPDARGRGDAPLLPGCCTRMQCKTAYQYEGGDHIIFVGEVLEFESTDAAPLVFQAGKYALASRKADETPLLQSASSEFGEDFLGYLLWRAYFQFHTMTRKQTLIAEHDDIEFLTLVTLFHNNWRTLDGLAKAMSHDDDRSSAERALLTLTDQGLIARKVDDADQATYGLTESGQEKTLKILAAAKSVESEFLEKLGQWEGLALKNLLKSFIVETDPGLPHLWERLHKASD